MKSFLFGADALPVQSKLFKAYCLNRVSNAEKLRGLKIDRYHPILSNEKIYKSMPIKEFEALLRTSKIVSFDKKLLEVKEKVYVNNLLIQALNPDLSRYTLFTNILEEYPSVASELVESLELIEKYGEWIGELFKVVIHEICPIRLKSSIKRFKGGFSDYNLIGSVFISHMPEPFSKLELSISLVHELGHQALMLIQAAENPIHDDSLEDWIYSSVRKVERPVLGAVHALIASLYMADFALKLLKNRENTDAELSYLVQQVEQNLVSVKDGIKATDTVKFTRAGDKVIRDVTNFHKNLINCYMSFKSL